MTTGGFIAAFPLDRRFGLIKGFHAYGDRMPRGPDGRLANDRPGRMVVDEALLWYAKHNQERFFLWVHLFEPHSPYGNPQDPAQARRPARERYDDDVAEADRQVGRLLDGMADTRATTLVVVAGIMVKPLVSTVKSRTASSPTTRPFVSRSSCRGPESPGTTSS